MAPARAETVVYRLHAPHYPAFDPSGAMRAAGRWHSQGTRVVYTAEHISLAVLETLVHTAGLKLPPRSLTRIAIPGAIAIEESGWLDLSASRTFGDAWVRAGRTAVLAVPSAVVSGLERNFVLNPSHPDFSKIRFEKSQKFSLDERLIALR